MTTAIYLIGEPGVGKTTTMRALLTRFQVAEAQKLQGQLWAEPLYDANFLVGYHLGKRRSIFSGTDALSMSVCPTAINWLETTQPLPQWLLGEGSRLSTPKFLEVLHRKTDFLLVLLQAANAETRRESRGSSQNATWIRGRVTQANNLLKRNQHWRSLVLDTSSTAPTEIAAIIWANVPKANYER